MSADQLSGMMGSLAGGTIGVLIAYGIIEWVERRRRRRQLEKVSDVKRT